VAWDPDRRAEPGLFSAQFCICGATWTAVALLLAGAIRSVGFIAAVVTGMVLVVVSWMLVKQGSTTGRAVPRMCTRPDPLTVGVGAASAVSGSSLVSARSDGATSRTSNSRVTEYPTTRARVWLMSDR
jgi:hypothetical protein